ncbi:hypothetical protein [Mycoplasma seminis]|uniref:Variable surface lipoprotein n=1 Tax=Mycoplasma seminis TaxID=512749 RepID=A0ABY9HDM6_9MOLU|nr:hypothetical protein [Mycoplasma seminis]WLP85788.1 hypothetical protein Q8852_01410 [Mycoplasma seminis]
MKLKNKLFLIAAPLALATPFAVAACSKEKAEDNKPKVDPEVIKLLIDAIKNIQAKAKDNFDASNPQTSQIQLVGYDTNKFEVIINSITTQAINNSYEVKYTLIEKQQNNTENNSDNTAANKAQGVVTLLIAPSDKK